MCERPKHTIHTRDMIGRRAGGGNRQCTRTHAHRTRKGHRMPRGQNSHAAHTIQHTILQSQLLAGGPLQMQSACRRQSAGTRGSSVLVWRRRLLRQASHAPGAGAPLAPVPAGEGGGCGQRHVVILGVPREEALHPLGQRNLRVVTCRTSVGEAGAGERRGASRRLAAHGGRGAGAAWARMLLTTYC